MVLLRVQTALVVLALTTSDYLRDQVRRLREEQDGLTTTEIAVITFLLVGAAIVVVGLIFAAAKNNAENIPVPDAPAG